MFLDRIIAHKIREVAAAKRKLTYRELEKQFQPPVVKNFVFHQALSSAPLALIAEMKKASPSKGLLCPRFDPQAFAELYTQNGARAISVLTDQEFFQGSLEYLKTVKAVSNLPVLRKDFIIDAYQIMEAAVYQADAILLIAAILDVNQLKDFLDMAAELGLSCLTEVHNYQELEKALNAEAAIIGVNNRDLKTFEVKLDTSRRLIKEIPASLVKVSESGIFTRDDALKLQEAGFNAILVGEAIVKSSDRAAKIKELASL